MNTMNMTVIQVLLYIKQKPVGEHTFEPIIEDSILTLILQHTF